MKIEAPHPLLIGADDIRQITRRLGKEIMEDLGHVPITAVVVLTGAMIFAADLLRELPHADIEVTYVTASSYSGGFQKGSTILQHHSEITPDRAVLIVEDIVDTGETISLLKEQLTTLGCKEIRCVSFIEKLDRRSSDVQIDYSGVTMNGFYLYGYGLDMNGRWRNLPGIHGWRPTE